MYVCLQDRNRLRLHCLVYYIGIYREGDACLFSILQCVLCCAFFSGGRRELSLEWEPVDE